MQIYIDTSSNVIVSSLSLLCLQLMRVNSNKSMPLPQVMRRFNFLLREALSVINKKRRILRTDRNK